MRHALIRDGRVENIIVLDPESGWTPPEGTSVAPIDGASVTFGYLYDGETFSPPPEPEPPAPVFPKISDRQFYQALATEPYATATGVTMAEAKAAVKIGQLPASIQAVVDAIEDEAERDRADMLLSGATIFEREHPEVSRFAAALSWTDEQVDAFWLFAAAL